MNATATHTTAAPPPLPELVSEGLRNIPLGNIEPNPNNPRKVFEKKPLEELAESIRAHGVRQPILVRPIGAGKFQLVVGERRWRASKLAGKREVPAIVDPNLTDSQALEIMVIENLQREDVHPLDEAMGYKALLDAPAEPKRPKHTVETLAAKVGKSESYVYQRLKLSELVKGAQDEFRSGFITAAHAIDIARLQPADQDRALEFCRKPEYGGNRRREQAPGFRELRKWIQENVQLNLDKAPFDVTDAKLVPTAGACTDCPKRTGTTPALFEGMGKNNCMDPTCYQSKKMALVNIHVGKIATKAGVTPVLISDDYYPDRGQKQKGVLYEDSYKTDYYSDGKRQKIAPDSCKSARLGVYVDGAHAGSSVWICISKKCEEHKDNWGSRGGLSDAVIRRRQRIARHFTSRIFISLAAKLVKRPLSRADRNLIAFEFFQKLGHYSETPLITALEWEKKCGEYNGKSLVQKKIAGMTERELEAHLLLFAIAPDLNSRTTAEAKRLGEVARRHGVDTAAAVLEATRKFTKKPKAKAKKAKKAA